MDLDWQVDKICAVRKGSITVISIVKLCRDIRRRGSILVGGVIARKAKQVQTMWHLLARKLQRKIFPRPLHGIFLVISLFSVLSPLFKVDRLTSCRIDPETLHETDGLWQAYAVSKGCFVLKKTLSILRIQDLHSGERADAKVNFEELIISMRRIHDWITPW